ncbi:MAG: hypothetical protein WAL63_15110 [Solirubrobacteraceae bacterium]
MANASTQAYPTETGQTTRTEKGAGLARGPALVLGTILTAAGLYLLYKAHTFPKFSNLPNGHAPRDGKFFFNIFAANGWTGMLTAVAGALLLFGAAQHLLAKTMSLIVGVALGAATVISVISGNVLGMASANGWTELLWGASAVILLFNTLLPRRRRTVVVADDNGVGRGTVGRTGAAPGAVAARDREATAARDSPASAAAAQPTAETRVTQPAADTAAQPAANETAPREGVATRDDTAPVAGREETLPREDTVPREEAMPREETVGPRDAMPREGTVAREDAMPRETVAGEDTAPREDVVDDDRPAVTRADAPTEVRADPDDPDAPAQ